MPASSFLVGSSGAEGLCHSLVQPFWVQPERLTSVESADVPSVHVEVRKGFLSILTTGVFIFHVYMVGLSPLCSNGVTTVVIHRQTRKSQYHRLVVPPQVCDESCQCLLRCPGFAPTHVISTGVVGLGFANIYNGLLPIASEGGFGGTSFTVPLF
jgi:hypothetical protein